MKVTELDEFFRRHQHACKYLLSQSEQNPQWLRHEGTGAMPHGLDSDSQIALVWDLATDASYRYAITSAGSINWWQKLWYIVIPEVPAPSKPKPSVDDVVAEVRAELDRATAKHPNWPTDPFHALAIIGEEFGELQQTFLKSTYEGGKAPDKAEAVQLAAMALRFLQHWDDYCPNHASLEEQAPKWLRHEGGAMPEGVGEDDCLAVWYDDVNRPIVGTASVRQWRYPCWYMVIPAPPAPPKGGEG